MNMHYIHIYIRSLVCIIFCCASFLSGIEIETQNNVTLDEAFSDIPIETQQLIASYCLSGPNADLASQQFIKKYFQESGQKKLAILAILSRPENYNNINVDASRAFLLHNIKEKNVLEKFHESKKNYEKIHKSKINYYDTFQCLSKEKQNDIIDFLYEKKYSGSLWQHFGKIIAEQKTSADKKQASKQWITKDPAANLYTQLIANQENQYNDFEIQGIEHSGLGDSIDITKSIYYKTELPLLAVFNTKNFRFKCDIDKIHDVDVEALKIINDKPIYLIFKKSLENTDISSNIKTIANITLVCEEEAPKQFKQLQKADVVNNNNYGCPYYNKEHYTSYCLFDSYWRIKALGKIGLFFGGWYLIKKCLIDEFFSFDAQQKNLIQAAKIGAFNTEIKPLLTPEINTALQIHAHYKPLPNILSENIDPFSNIPITITKTSLNNANDIVTQTEGLLSRKYSIDYDAIKTPLNIVGKNTTFFPGCTALSIMVSHFFSTIIRFCSGPDKSRYSQMHYPYKFFESLLDAPAWIINSVMALGSSIFKPEWLSYYEKPVFRVIVPKDKDQNHSNE